MSSIDLELYWMRHGESEMNTLPTFSGRSNETPLTPKGIEQSKKLGQFLSKQEVFPSVVYVSPALRAAQTAEYCLAEMGLDVEPLIHDALQELDQGDWVGRVRSEVYADANVIAEMEKLGKDFKQGGAESITDAALRGMGWISETFDDHKPDTIPDRRFVFSHAVIISSMASHIYGWPYQETRASRVPNASISLFVRRDNNWELEYFGLETDQASELVE
jgi:broad specificity phosphatase PhoE